jgi:hypothetical protein
MRKRLLTAISFFIGLVSQAQQEDSIFIKRISDEILTNGKAMTISGTTKKVGARLSGSPQMVKG